MHCIRFAAIAVIATVSLLLYGQPPRAYAASSPGLLLISEVETTGMDGGGNDLPAEEFIKLTNVSSDTLEVSGWKLNYINGGGSESLLASLDGLVLPQGSVLIAHTGYPLPSGVVADKSFSGSTSVLGKTVGQVRLVNSGGQTADLVGWGSATVAAPWPKLSQIAPGFSVKRIIPGHPLFGTGLDYTYAAATQPLTPAGGAFVPDICLNLANVQTSPPIDTVIDASGNCVAPPDVCLNISGNQMTMPIGYMADANGDCQPDACLNMTGLQISVPDGYDDDAAGNCYQHDSCDNVDNVQPLIPSGFVRQGMNNCVLDVVPLEITELLPNADGSDSGNEFIELYNPTDRTIDLMNYTLLTGVDADKSYSFPSGSMIAPGAYLVFYDSTLHFTLVNTASQVTLKAIDGSLVSQSDAYANPPDGQSWVLIDGVWQYTNQPTPGTTNLPSLDGEIVDSTSSASTPAPCPAGKYRHPLTNRCRSVESDVSVLAGCDADQYRNPETNRCRKITLAGDVAVCKDGQYRSEETNRCRNIVTASTQKPCKDNQFRSEETGRCRNLQATGVPAAAFAVQPVKETGLAFVGWWALGGVSLLAVGYGAWEWRREVATVWHRVIGHFGPK